MSLTDAFLEMPTPSLPLNIILWLLGLVLLLYFGRLPAHRVILSFSRVVHNAMRILAKSILQGEHKLMLRNKEVLLAAGREAAERIIEREFHRVDSTVRRDLSEYPAMHRRINEQVSSIDEDYQQSVEVPPTPPGWVKAVEAVAKIPQTKGDPTVANILEDIHESLDKASNKALEEYRKSSHRRHMLLHRMMPHWRKLSVVLNQVHKSIESLLARGKVIDRHMDEYENIMRQTDKAERTLSSSSLTQFFISAFVLLIAVGGAMVNFFLIAHPMSEMVGAGDAIQLTPSIQFQISSIAALVIILVEVAMGLFLMESMRITRLFPVIGALNDKLRIRMIWITFGILLALAFVEAGLAFYRDVLAQYDEATLASLGNSAVDTATVSDRWITTAAQVGMGFILPFALVFVAIPLESFVHSLRTVIGIVAIATLRFLALSCRVVGNFARFMGNALINLYDLLIFMPLWVEERILKRDKSESKNKRNQSVEPGLARGGEQHHVY